MAGGHFHRSVAARLPDAAVAARCARLGLSHREILGTLKQKAGIQPAARGLSSPSHHRQGHAWAIERPRNTILLSKELSAILSLIAD